MRKDTWHVIEQCKTVGYTRKKVKKWLAMRAIHAFSHSSHSKYAYPELDEIYLECSKILHQRYVQTRDLNNTVCQKRYQWYLIISCINFYKYVHTSFASVFELGISLNTF